MNMGLTKDDITDMVLTHLHFDHCGGSIERLVKISLSLHLGMPTIGSASHNGIGQHSQIVGKKLPF